jgi:hypothetical protein
MEDQPLAAALEGRKNEIVAKWFERMLRTYPEPAAQFLSEGKDPFHNPVGYTLKEGLSAIFEGLIRSAGMESMVPILDGIVRIRAVQDFSASQAVSFVFLLKQIISAEFAATTMRISDELEALENRIDELALLAFDLFMKCREQIYEVRANERKRMAFLSERAHRKGTAGSVE